MEITVIIKKQTLVVSLSGELDHHTAKEVKSLVEEVVKNRGVKNLVFDFGKLSFMDSSGIGVIIGRYKLICSLGGSVAIVKPNHSVEKLIKMSGINKLIPVFDSVDTALTTLQEDIS